jgi:hypothetical protein
MQREMLRRQSHISKRANYDQMVREITDIIQGAGNIVGKYEVDRSDPVNVPKN